MYSIEAYDKVHTMCYDFMSSAGGIPLHIGSKTDALKFLCNTLKLSDIWLQMSEINYMSR